MSKSKIILLDFDGVIVDGICEYWYSSVLACSKYLNSDHILSKHTLDLSETFLQMRPWVKYGWEMVLITHEIIKQKNPLTINNKDLFLQNYSDSCQRILKENSWKSETLQKCLDNARKYQISTNLEEWVSLHRPYPEVIDFIKKAELNNIQIGIITTKNKTFTSKILEKYNIFPKFVYGYESGTKVEIIKKLIYEYEIKGFIEDRRETLNDIINCKETEEIPCFLANWGYLKRKDMLDIPEQMNLIKLNELDELLANLA